jgi:hypothetical protein
MQLGTDRKPNQAGVELNGTQWLLVYVGGVNLLVKTVKKTRVPLIGALQGGGLSQKYLTCS